MADAGDEMPPGQQAAAGHDAEQSEAAAESPARIAKRKAVPTPREDQYAEMFTSALKRFMEGSSELEAEFSALELTLAGLQEAIKAAAVERRRAYEDLAKACARGKELQDARKALIERFLKYKLIIKESSVIGIKRMGELEEVPFKHACIRKYGNEDDPEAKASMLLTVWQDELKKHTWQPFKTIEVDGKTEVVVDEADAKLTLLQMEYGEDVCSAVKVAVAELRDYNTIRGYPVPELWNFGEGRKATVAEALNCIFEHLKK